MKTIKCYHCRSINDVRYCEKEIHNNEIQISDDNQINYNNTGSYAGESFIYCHYCYNYEYITVEKDPNSNTPLLCKHYLRCHDCHIVL